MNTKDVLALSAARVALSEGRALQIRRAARLSQSEMARLIGVRPATVSRWESGERTPRGAAGVRYGHLLATLTERVGA